MLEKANNALQRLKGQVLQMTCQGLLRLCVVAPRVTIAFEMKNINVAAVLPSGEIRAMLERELLPKYTKVFLQKEENRGPENEEMEKWLQVLTLTQNMLSLNMSSEHSQLSLLYLLFQ